MKLYSIHDSKAEFYSAPFVQRNKGEATRGFINAVQSSESELSKDPASYTLFEIASFDPETGCVTPNQPIVSIGNGVEYLNTQV